MWRVIRFNILMADLTLVPSKTMKVAFIRYLCMHGGRAATGAVHNADTLESFT